MKLQHIVKAQQFDIDLLSDLFKSTSKIKNDLIKGKKIDKLNGKILATVFYEPSTRTRLSFESAMIRLGGSVITTENAKEFSSAAKGENIEDTIRVMQAYADAIVIRHYESGTAQRASNVSSVPIINAGDGPGQHPTQALIDLYTIQEELGDINGISIAMVGDLANGRTVRSLCYLLSKYKDVNISFVAPPVVSMKEDIKQFLVKKGVKFIEESDLKKVAKKVDVIYQTRIQKERFGDRMDEYEQAIGKYIINQDILDVMSENSIIMHPLPRLDEISSEVDLDPRAAYFRQAHNGVFVRAALLKYLLS
jgi:aspartate carbamoyltransferase catalytic subunit